MAQFNMGMFSKKESYWELVAERYRKALEEIENPEKVWKEEGMTYYQQEAINYKISRPETYRNIARRALGTD